MPVVAVVVREPGRGAGGRDQLVDLAGGGPGVGGGEDGGEPPADLPHRGEVELGERSDVADLVVAHEVRERGHVRQPVRCRVVLRCGVHQIDHGVEGAPGVVGDQHDSLPGLEGGQAPADAGRW